MTQRCDRALVGEFDYSGLDAAFARLSKPAQRALINNGILAPNDLARRSRRDVAGMHGIGPSAFPLLTEALRAAGLDFRA